MTSEGSDRTAGRALVECLRLHGVDRVFCVPGESYLEVLDALHDAPDIHLVVAKHEGAAANMAEADGKLTGRPGVCMVTRGPGATHASCGVHIAQQDSTPLLLFIGQISRDDRGRDVFQEVDYRAMFGSLAKWVVEIDTAARLPEIVARAFQVAVTGRPGPVVVALPEDMLTAACSVPACRATPLAQPALAPDLADRIAAVLADARQPLVVVGGGGWTDAGSAALRTFVARWNLPVAASFRRQDLLDNRDAHYVGHLSLGMHPALRTRMAEADVLLVLGARLTDTATDGYTAVVPPKPRQRLVHVHVDPQELGRVFQPELAVACAPGLAVTALAELPAPATVPWAGWTEAARRAHEGFEECPARPGHAAGVDLAVAVRQLSHLLQDDAIVTNGAGNYAIWVHRFHRYRTMKSQLAPVCGAMGYGLPAAIAAALRSPQREVVCFAGDGCFLMYPQELATAVEHGVRMLVLVVNNGWYGTIRMHQERRHPGRAIGTQLHGPDYVALARAFGAQAERVDATAAFPAAVARARAHAGVSLIELVVDPLQSTPDSRLPAPTGGAAHRDGQRLHPVDAS